MHDPLLASQVVLILAPIGKDAEVAVSVLHNQGIVAQVCQNLPELYDRLQAEGNFIGALLLAEEALASPLDCADLAGWLENQEPWSELPIIFLIHPGQPSRVTGERSRSLSLRGALTLLERPMRAAALVGALRVALQARARQYQVRDLLESQRRTGLELHQARLKAEAADRAKDQFLANLSHELRTPLNAILGWTHIMKSARQDEALIGQGLDVLQRNTNTLIELISDLVDTSRIVAGTLTMDFQEVDLKRVVRASVETLRVQADEKDITLESLVKVPEEVSCTVWGDEARLHQILANLLSNALKFTPSGGSVSVQLRKAQASAVITVRDTGKGISAEFLPHIFNRFSQDDKSARENRGLGLGLAICKHLVELHSGTIVAESRGPGRGAAIKVELRTIASKYGSAGERSGRLSSRKADGAADTKLQRIKVVAVDDNADSRDLLKIILERSGAEVMVVDSGLNALAAIKKVHPHVLICDLTMPEMDGYDLLDNIRSLEPEFRGLPVIAFTAAARIEDRAATRQAGFQAHLAKPVDAAKLVTTILELTNERTD